MITGLSYVAGGSAFTFLCTALGAALVLFLSSKPSPAVNKISLGFAAGIMIAASVWSLLLPAMKMSEDMGKNPLFSSSGGFLLGILFLILLDRFTPHLHVGSKEAEGPKTGLKKSSLLFLAVTIHNIPEGMAVGLTCAAAGISGSTESFTAAAALALGMGIQNVPEGAAVALPYHSIGLGRIKAFMLGTLSGAVEPVAAFIVFFLSSYLLPVMPWLLSFAAGAMMYVVIEELIPEARLGEHSDLGTLSVLSGFLMMMVLDTALG